MSYFYLLWILPLLIGSRDDLIRQQVGVVYLSEDKNEILFTDSFNFPGDISIIIVVERDSYFCVYSLSPQH